MGLSVCPKNKCAGCMACADICPAGAVTVEDRVLNMEAVINETACLHCDLCRKVCQNHEPPALKSPLFWKQGWAADETVRASSSSGGFAAAIMSRFIRDGGYVCSCLFREGAFVFDVASSIDEINDFKGSKYVKSSPAGAYRQVKDLLSQGKKVLFAGLPCQAAAMKNYCRGRDENLYIVDLVCHGSPSLKVLSSFLKGKKADPKDLRDITFRAVDAYPGGEEIRLTPDGIEDYYTSLFMDAVTYTDNCYECRYAAFERVSDLTLGDAWGSELPVQERKKGISLALCMTPKGEELLDGADLFLTDVDIEKVKKINKQLCHPAEKPSGHDKMLAGIAQGKSFDSMVRKLRPAQYGKDRIKTLLNAAGLYKREGLFRRFRVRIVKK